MEIGQVVDYVEEYNRVHDVKTETKPHAEEDTKRKATQADWDWLLG